MKQLLSIAITSLFLQPAFGQKDKVAGYLSAQYNACLYDVTKPNNLWGFGLGAQIFFNNQGKFKPTAEFTTEAYLMDDKVYRLDANGDGIEEAEAVTNLFFGSAFQPARQVFMCFSAGPSFINRRTCFGLRPALGFYFSSSQRWMAKFSYTNIFNRYEKTGRDFGAMSIAIGCKLF